MKECICISFPDYHRKDCFLFDEYGNVKKAFLLSNENLINDKIQSLIQDVVPFFLKLRVIKKGFSLRLINKMDSSTVLNKDIPPYISEVLEKIFEYFRTELDIYIELDKS